MTFLLYVVHQIYYDTILGVYYRHGFGEFPTCHFSQSNYKFFKEAALYSFNILCRKDLTKIISFSRNIIQTKERLPSLAASLPMCLNGPLFLTPAKDLRAGLTEWAAAPHSGPGRSCLPLPTLFQVRAALQLCSSVCACVCTKAGAAARPHLFICKMSDTTHPASFSSLPGYIVHYFL